MGLVLWGEIGKEILGIIYLANAEEHKETYDYISKRGVLPISLNVHLMSYTYRQILRTSFYQKVSKKLDELDGVVPLSEASKEQIDVFLEEHPSERKYIESEVLDYDLTPIILGNGKIRAVMYFAQIGEKTIANSYTYADKSVKLEVFYPLLVLAAVNLGLKRIGDDGSIIFMPVQKHVYNGFKKELGEPQADHIVNVYYTICETKGDMELVQNKIKAYNASFGAPTFLDQHFLKYLDSPISLWGSSIVQARMPYLNDLSAMPKEMLDVYKSELREQLTLWSYNAEWEIDTIINAAKRRRDKTDFAKIDSFEKRECEEIYQKYYYTLELPEVENQRYELSMLKYYITDGWSRELSDVLPEYIKAELDKREYFMVCAVDPEGELVGYTVMTWSDYYDRTMVMVGNYVILPYQETSLIGELLTRSMKLARTKGSEYFYLRHIDPLGALEEGMPIAGGEEQLLMYGVRELRNNLTLIDSARVKNITDRSLPLVQQANQLRESEGIVFYTTGYDPQMQLFVEYQDELMAMLCAKQLSEDTIIIYDQWISEKNRDEKLLYKMMTVLLKKIDVLMSKMTKILIRAKDEETLSIYQKLLGNNYEKCTYMETLYKLEAPSELTLFDEGYEPLQEGVKVISAFVEKLKLYKIHLNHEEEIGAREVMMLSNVQGLFGQEIVRKIKG